MPGQHCSTKYYLSYNSPRNHILATNVWNYSKKKKNICITATEGSIFIGFELTTFNNFLS
jgi:hypothetical protein